MKGDVLFVFLVTSWFVQLSFHKYDSGEVIDG